MTKTTTPSALVRTEIERFLRSPNAEVLCISGAWGVGKTHLWKEVLTTTSESKDKPSLLEYSYVSLFGVDSLEGLRQAIFANQISLEENDAPGLAAKAISLVKRTAKRSQDILEQVPKVGALFKALGALYFSSVRNMVICIDDLERRSNTLTVKDVLGLISFLKEERKCKVILLLNDGELGDETEAFRSYFEKTIDVHLRFDPTAQESSAIAFPDPREVDKRIRDNCVILGIKNIRIIHKIRRAVMDAHPLLSGYDQILIEGAERAIVMLNWAILEGDGAPSIAHLQARNGLTIYKMEKKELTPEEEQWNSLLDKYNWGTLDELDEFLIPSLQAGYFDPLPFKAAADKVQKRVEHQKQDGKYEESWKPYHGSFDNNPDEVLDGMYAAFKQTYKTISFMNLDGTIRLFRELGRNEQAEELLKFYIDHRDEQQEFWDLTDDVFSGHILDAGVRTAIEEKFKNYGVPEANMADVMEAMGTTNSHWSEEQIEVIADVPVADYVKLFREARGDKMRWIVKGGLLARRYGNPSEAMKTVAHKTMEALYEIAEGSPLNRRRLESLFQIVIMPKTPDMPASPAAAENQPGNAG